MGGEGVVDVAAFEVATLGPDPGLVLSVKSTPTTDLAPAATRATSSRPCPLCRCTTAGDDASNGRSRSASRGNSEDWFLAWLRSSPYSRTCFSDAASHASRFFLAPGSTLQLWTPRQNTSSQDRTRFTETRITFICPVPADRARPGPWPGMSTRWHGGCGAGCSAAKFLRTSEPSPAAR